MVNFSLLENLAHKLKGIFITETQDSRQTPDFLPCDNNDNDIDDQLLQYKNDDEEKNVVLCEERIESPNTDRVIIETFKQCLDDNIQSINSKELFNEPIEENRENISDNMTIKTENKLYQSSKDPVEHLEKNNGPDSYLEIVSDDDDLPIVENYTFVKPLNDKQLQKSFDSEIKKGIIETEINDIYFTDSEVEKKHEIPKVTIEEKEINTETETSKTRITTDIDGLYFTDSDSENAPDEGGTFKSIITTDIDGVSFSDSEKETTDSRNIKDANENDDIYHSLIEQVTAIDCISAALFESGRPETAFLNLLLQEQITDSSESETFKSVITKMKLFLADKYRYDNHECKRWMPDDLWENLMPHQKDGVSWLFKLHENMKPGLLGDDMGYISIF